MQPIRHDVQYSRYRTQCHRGGRGGHKDGKEKTSKHSTYPRRSRYPTHSVSGETRHASMTNVSQVANVESTRRKEGSRLVVAALTAIFPVQLQEENYMGKETRPARSIGNAGNQSALSFGNETRESHQRTDRTRRFFLPGKPACRDASPR